MLNVYSRTKEGGTHLSRNFVVREFACKDGSDPVFVDSDLVALLQNIRDHFGKPLNINSAYRTAAHNRAVGDQHADQGHSTGNEGRQDVFHTAHLLQPAHRLLFGRTSTCTKPFSG